MNETTISLAVVIAAGALGSATLLPMKFVRQWRWENMWLVYALNAYLLFPLLMAWITVPGLRSVYTQAGSMVVTEVLLFGFGWGVSVVMLGIAAAAVGLAVSTGIILGCSIALGSLIPLLLLGSDQFLTWEGARIALGDLLVLAGVLCCARAAQLREPDAAVAQVGTRLRGRGLLICFVAGLLTPLLNFALASGKPIVALAIEHGASNSQAANSVWGLAVSAGSLPSILYCCFLLARNRSLPDYLTPRRAINVVLCLTMAALFIASTIGYGFGATRMGELGPVIGWPVYVSSLLIGNSFWGWMTGEWRGAPRSAAVAMALGIALQVAGIIVLFMVKLTPTT
jgi:L-rhamnose-H+ transport protein